MTIARSLGPDPFDDPRITGFGIGMLADGTLDVVKDEADLRRRVAERDLQSWIAQSILDSGWKETDVEAAELDPAELEDGFDYDAAQ